MGKPHKLSAPRFLKLARQLHHYDGAFRHALQAKLQPQAAGPATPTTHQPVDTPPEVLAKLSESDRFPGIEYDD